MHALTCPSPGCQNKDKIIKRGFFRIGFNNQKVRRYQCVRCLKTFSFRSSHETFRQKKPYLNQEILSLLCHGMTMRGIARHLQINYKTVERKFLFLAQRAYRLTPNVEELQFDEFETIEHTKCKPLSILVCVDGKGEPLALNVAKVPAKGKLAAFSVKKYGKRLDERRNVALSTFANLNINPHMDDWPVKCQINL